MSLSRHTHTRNTHFYYFPDVRLQTLLISPAAAPNLKNSAGISSEQLHMITNREKERL